LPGPPERATGGTGRRSSAAVPASLAHGVITSLREAIQSGRLRPGARLVEDRIAADLRVSRVPVREALRTLAVEGLVVLRPRRGAVVAELSEASAREMIEVRATLEGLNARLAARHRDPARLAALEAVLREGNAVIGRRRRGALPELNARFHDLLATAGGNAVLGEIMRTLRTRTTGFFDATSRERATETWAEHAAILQAVIAGDEDFAELLAKRHVNRAGDEVLSRLAATAAEAR